MVGYVSSSSTLDHDFLNDLAGVLRHVGVVSSPIVGESPSLFFLGLLGGLSVAVGEVGPSFKGLLPFRCGEDVLGVEDFPPKPGSCRTALQLRPSRYRPFYFGQALEGRPWG